MGIISRSNRANRFIEEFNEDYVNNTDIAEGTELIVTDVHLIEDDLDNTVRKLIVCEEIGTPLTKKHNFISADTVLYDLEYSDIEDYITQMTLDLEIPEEEVIKRLKKADLL